ncbi:unnamed protein product [Spirodela intermedia]|uniref:Ribosomal protein eL8/eL30/eS12/Gadd45 domain-containing protein n=1 Tax=Spirodela intermedia TaxID=51605 RepID=A0ABN7EC20_SPIIN|nr:unnamed protein product [Spirodela intermedia]
MSLEGLLKVFRELSVRFGGDGRRTGGSPRGHLRRPLLPPAMMVKNSGGKSLLASILAEVELERLSKGGIPDKIWTKQQFAIGINDVTRVLERMSRKEKGLQAEKDSAAIHHRPSPLVSLQAVLVASDCTPRYLTHHIPTLANSLGVPVVPVRDYGGGSLRLGELVKLKTAMAVGVKARGSRINKAMEEFLRCEGWWVSHS